MEKEPIKTVRPDAKGRIVLGKLAEGISSFQVTRDKQGRLILEPFMEVPAQEEWLYRNKDAMTSVMRGLKEAARGKGKKIGDFSQFADDVD